MNALQITVIALTCLNVLSGVVLKMLPLGKVADARPGTAGAEPDPAGPSAR